MSSLSIAIITDSTSDMDQELASALNVEVAPLKIHFGGEVYTQGVDLTTAEFYHKLAACRELPKTSQITPQTFTEAFEKHLSRGDDVLGIFISSELSGTYQSALIARETLNSDRIHLVDSRTVTFGLCALVKEAVRMRDEGLDVKKIHSEVESLKERLVLYAVIDCLKYLKMGGRLSAASATVANVLNLKPIVCVDKDGQVNAIGKARGQDNAYRWILDRLAEKPLDLSRTVMFGNSNCPDKMAEFIEYTTSRTNIEEYTSTDIGAVVGVHAGPGCVGICGFLQSNR